jgi:hypothetical protein
MILYKKYQLGGNVVVNKLNNMINPIPNVGTGAGDANSAYEISKRYGNVRLDSTKEAGSNIMNKRFYYRVKDANTGVIRNLSMEELLQQFPNYRDTTGLSASYQTGGSMISGGTLLPKA